MKKIIINPSRRDFVLAASSVAATSSAMSRIEEASADKLGAVMPRRRLGKTEMMVTRYCPGGLHFGKMEAAENQRAIDRCIEMGVRFFDTAASYGKGLSEELYGKHLTPKYREHIQIMSKGGGKNARAVREQLEGGLKRMKTDYIDLYMIHAINSVEDGQRRLKNGVLDELRKAKAEGKIRHIGFSGHRTTAGLNWLINEGFPDVEAVLLPINVADPSYDSFILNTVPLLQKKDVGILAMKTLGNGGLLGRKRSQVNGNPAGRSVIPEILSVREAHRFALSMPVASMVSGSNDLQQLEYNLETATDFRPMDAPERDRLIASCAEQGKTGEMEFYKWPKMSPPKT
ncbi:MAG: aldo/keto reductase [Pontiella sp.]|nr:aldo/keto reductase [Pontiella sp.]